MAAGRAVLFIVLVGTVVRLIFAASTGLGYDESYMVGNARELALGYVDHPPLHVWIAGLAARLFGSEAPIFVRLPFILMFAGSTWLMFRLTTRLFGEGAALWATIAFSLTPVLSVSDGVFVLPDGPAILFLLASAVVLARIFFDETASRSALLLWLVAGALAGLAMLSKFNAGFFPVAVFVYLLTVPSARRYLATPGPWLAAVVALVVLSPAVIWNLQHGIVGISFQAQRVGGNSIRLDLLAQQVGGQLAYLTPWLAIPFAAALFRGLAAGRRDPRGWFVALAAIGPIAVFTILALWSRGLPHWTAPGWLFAIPLFGRQAEELAARRPIFARRYMQATAAIFALLFVAVFFQAKIGGLIPEQVVRAQRGLDPTIDLVDWTNLKTALAERGLLDANLVVAATNWRIAGKAGYALGPSVPVLCLCDSPQQFAVRADPSKWVGRNVVLVSPRDDFGQTIERYFDGAEPLPPVPIDRAGKPVLALSLSLGKNLHFPAK